MNTRSKRCTITLPNVAKLGSIIQFKWSISCIVRQLHFLSWQWPIPYHGYNFWYCCYSCSLICMWPRSNIVELLTIQFLTLHYNTLIFSEFRLQLSATPFLKWIWNFKPISFIIQTLVLHKIIAYFHLNKIYLIKRHNERDMQLARLLQTSQLTNVLFVIGLTQILLNLNTSTDAIKLVSLPLCNDIDTHHIYNLLNSKRVLLDSSYD